MQEKRSTRSEYIIFDEMKEKRQEKRGIIYVRVTGKKSSGIRKKRDEGIGQDMYC